MLIKRFPKQLGVVGLWLFFTFQVAGCGSPTSKEIEKLRIQKGDDKRSDFQSFLQKVKAFNLSDHQIIEAISSNQKSEFARKFSMTIDEFERFSTEYLWSKNLCIYPPPEVQNPNPAQIRAYDDRKDFYQISTYINDPSKAAKIEQYANQTGILIHNELDAQGYLNEFCSLRDRFITEDNCYVGGFGDQKVPPTRDHATCFLIKENLIATAAHNMHFNYKHAMVIFFASMRNENDTALSLIGSHTFLVDTILYYSGPHEFDFAIYRLDSNASWFKGIEFDFTQWVDTKKVYAFGHPLGLPLKFADHSDTYDSPFPNMFSAKLDLFSGNSGSPIFDQSSDKLIGIHCGGPDDFPPSSNGNCATEFIATGDLKERCLQLWRVQHGINSALLSE
jgi:hypothetical protein